MKWVFVAAVCAAGPAGADGVDAALVDPPVVPIVRAPASDFAPLTASNGAMAGPSVTAPAGPTRIGGYPVDIAWGHVAVAAALLGGMYLFGESEAASSTN